MVNYANSKVYKIWSTQGDKIYVGSTTKHYLSQRMDNHRSEYKRWKQDKCAFVSSYIIFEEYGLENCFIELLEAQECFSKDELSQLEGKYIRELACENKRIAGRTKKEYLEENKERIKQYHEDNKEIIVEYQKQYREENKEKKLYLNKEYYKQNKDSIKQKNSEKYDCDCGGKYTRSGKAQHFKTTKHCQFIESQKSLTEPLV